MTVHPEATTGLTFPAEREDYCADCATAPCSHGPTEVELDQRDLLLAEMDENERLAATVLRLRVLSIVLALIGAVLAFLLAVA